MTKIDFPVVGIGASAGGLKALQEFFECLDSESEMAFVVITHLAPQKTSAMDELLAAHTSMEVHQVREETEISPNNIYVIPPAKRLYFEGNYLKLAEKEEGTQAVIDIFFRSMAKECEKRAIGIILSGTGSDGTLGLKAVKEHGGITMVQDPREAEYSGMPRSALDTDLVDFVLPVKELAQKVLTHKEILGAVSLPLREGELSESENRALKNIFDLLASKRDHDFTHYKRSSVLRRLQRRMYVTNSKSIEEYKDYLEQNPDEITELYKDLLISVTNFFRDPEAFDILEKEVIPRLFENKEPEDTIRIWIAGCATGEEVYSLGILLHEYAATLNYVPQIKIFGTDISDEALRIARRAIYPKVIAMDVPDERLKRYFHKEEAGYRVCKEIRENVLISHHDLLSDPPFLNQDLISCRNLLIYFSHDLQNEVLKILHYALKAEGFLFLGMADSTIGAKDLFKPLDKSNALYQAKQVPTSKKDIPRFPLLPNMHRIRSVVKDKNEKKKDFSLDEIHHSLLASQYAPASVIIDENNQVMHSSRGIDQFLSYSEGEPTRDLLKMALPKIQRALRNIIFQFNQLDKPQPVAKEIKMQQEDNLKILNLKIRPIEVAGFPQGFRQITFEEIEEPDDKISQKISDSGDIGESEIVEQLESELEQTKEQLQQTIEEYETSNEELMASNEELQSMNEELQTTTEELETSKEELQSVNEELRTVNQELENKIDELNQANDDLKNLMEATEIGIIFVDKKLDVKLFTSNATKLFHLIDSDVGRPLSHVTHELAYEGSIKDIEQMLENLNPVQRQVTTKDGDWYIMHIKPYRTTEYHVEGAVITFVDITDLKKAETELSYLAGNETSLANLGRFILETTGLQPIIDKATTMLSDELGLEFVGLWEISREENKFLLKGVHGCSKEEMNKEEFNLSLSQNSEIDYTLEKEVPVVINNFEKDDRFTESQWVKDLGLVSGVSTVVRGSKDLHGILGVYSRNKRTFTSHEINFVQNTANMVGEAIERIETEEKLKAAYEALEKKIKAEKELQKEILEVEKEERWRLGQYLHDGTAQNLLGINMLLNIIEPRLQKLDEETKTELEKIKRLVVKSETNIRELSHFVLPVEGEKDIAEALKELITQTQELYNVACAFSSEGINGEIKDPTMSASLYYIAQEAIRNAVNHGNADHIDISLTIESESLNLTIKDNGVGYDKDNMGNGMGINIMKHRAELLGGSLKIGESFDMGGPG